MSLSFLLAGLLCGFEVNTTRCSAYCKVGAPPMRAVITIAFKQTESLSSFTSVSHHTTGIITEYLRYQDAHH